MYSTTQEQANLLNEVIEALKNKGAKMHHYSNGGSLAVMVMNESDYELRPYERYGYKGEDPYGVTFFIQETYRNNGTSENKSVYISVIKWEQCGRQIERVKISQKDGIKKRENAINKVVNAYLNIVK